MIGRDLGIMVLPELTFFQFQNVCVLNMCSELCFQVKVFELRRQVSFGVLISILQGSVTGYVSTKVILPNNGWSLCYLVLGLIIKGSLDYV